MPINTLSCTLVDILHGKPVLLVSSAYQPIQSVQHFQQYVQQYLQQYLQQYMQQYITACTVLHCPLQPGLHRQEGKLPLCPVTVSWCHTQIWDVTFGIYADHSRVVNVTCKLPDPIQTQFRLRSNTGTRTRSISCSCKDVTHRLIPALLDSQLKLGHNCCIILLAAYMQRQPLQTYSVCHVQCKNLSAPARQNWAAAHIPEAATSCLAYLAMPEASTAYTLRAPACTATIQSPLEQGCYRNAVTKQ